MIKKSIYANSDIKPGKPWNAWLMRQINQSSALTASQELEVGWQEKNQAGFLPGRLAGKKGKVYILIFDLSNPQTKIQHAKYCFKSASVDYSS